MINDPTRTLFCPRCDALMPGAQRCPHCAWERPSLVGELGRPVGAPLPLSRAVSGRPTAAGGAYWYAAPPDESETPGALVAVRSGGAVIERVELTALQPEGGLPVVTNLAALGDRLLLSCKDYAFGPRRPPKAILTVDPLTLEIVGRLPTPSLELSSPVYRDGVVMMTGVAPSAVYCGDPTAGRMRWKTELRDVNFQLAPAVAASTVAVVTGGVFDDYRRLLALNRNDGQVVWERQEPRYGALVADHERDRFYVAVNRSLAALDARDGRPIWSNSEMRRTSRGVTTASPVAVGDRLLAPSGTHDPERPYALYALDRETGRTLWQWTVPIKRFGHIMVTPFVQDARIVIGDGMGNLYTLDWDGNLLWQAHIGRRLTAQPLVNGGRLLVPNRDGLLHQLLWEAAFQPTEAPEQYAARGEWTTAAAAWALADPPNWSEAGKMLLQADDPRHALALFERAGAEAQAIEALGRLGELEQAAARAEAANLPATQARWLEAAERYGAAADLYRAQERWQDAGRCYELASKPLQAYEMYDKAGLPEDVARVLKPEVLALVEQKSNALLGLFQKAQQWEAAVERLERAGYVVPAADLLEEHAEWERALALRTRARQWGRVRELCRRLNRPLDEAAACEKWAAEAADAGERARRWETAGDLYAAQRAWEQAERCFRELPTTLKLAELFALQERYLEAAAVCTRREQRHVREAAGYYWKAALQREAGIPEAQMGRVLDRAAAELWEQAAYWYRLDGQVEKMERARHSADKWRRQPRLILEKTVHLDRPFVQGVVTEVVMTARNIGAGPAENIHVSVTGSARPELTHHSTIDLLAPDQAREVKLGLMPTVAAAAEQPLAFELWLTFSNALDDGSERAEIKVGPFEINETVLSNYYKDAIEAEAKTVQIFTAGSYYAAGDQMVINRASGAPRVLATED